MTRYITNQVTSALSHLRSRIKGKLNPERVALDAMSKLDSAQYKKPNLNVEKNNTEDDYQKDNEYVSEDQESKKFMSKTVTVNSNFHTRRGRPPAHNKNIKNNQSLPSPDDVIVLKKVPSSSWANPFVRAAMPTILLTIDSVNQSKEEIDTVSLRSQYVRDISEFQKILLSNQVNYEDVQSLSYMLCTYIDEKLSSSSLNTDISLLVQFHSDAWGGEKCFSILDNYLEHPNQNKDIIEFYYLFLSLGFLGKYGSLDNGIILLNDLKMKLKIILYKNEINDLTYLINSTGDNKILSWNKPLNLFIVSSIIFLMSYLIASLYLHNISRDLRNEILAWQPPVLPTLISTPPPELVKILDEGWLQIKEHPLGWLLIFTSDGAFNVGSSELTEKFKNEKNIERLGNALADYPGDFDVIGHTDNTPYRIKKMTNLQLSIDRAKTVADYLRLGTNINSKINRNIVYTGKGDTEPVASNSTPEGRSKNRRVDILWKIGRRQKEEVMKILNNSDYNNYDYDNSELINRNY